MHIRLSEDGQRLVFDCAETVEDLDQKFIAQVSRALGASLTCQVITQVFANKITHNILYNFEDLVVFHFQSKSSFRVSAVASRDAANTNERCFGDTGEFLDNRPLAPTPLSTMLAVLLEAEPGRLRDFPHTKLASLSLRTENPLVRRDTISGRNSPDRGIDGEDGTNNVRLGVPTPPHNPTHVQRDNDVSVDVVHVLI